MNDPHSSDKLLEYTKVNDDANGTPERTSTSVENDKNVAESQSDNDTNDNSSIKKSPKDLGEGEPDAESSTQSLNEQGDSGSSSSDDSEPDSDSDSDAAAPAVDQDHRETAETSNGEVRSRTYGFALAFAIVLAVLGLLIMAIVIFGFNNAPYVEPTVQIPMIYVFTPSQPFVQKLQALSAHTPNRTQPIMIVDNGTTANQLTAFSRSQHADWSMAVVSMADMIYVIGQNSYLPNQKAQVLAYNVTDYNVNLTLTESNEFEFPALADVRERHTVNLVANNTMLIVCGCAQSDLCARTCETLNLTRFWHEYAQFGRSIFGWSSMSLPVCGRGHSTTTLNDQGDFIVIAGQCPRPGGSQVQPFVYVYNVHGRVWRKLKSLPDTLKHHATATLNGVVYVCGGITMKGEAVDSCYKYNQGQNKWLEISSMNVARAKFALVTAEGRVYAIGGTDGQRLRFDSIEIYSAADNKWTIADTTLESPSDEVAATVVMESVLLSELDL